MDPLKHLTLLHQSSSDSQHGLFEPAIIAGQGLLFADYSVCNLEREKLAVPFDLLVHMWFGNLDPACNCNL